MQSASQRYAVIAASIASKLASLQGEQENAALAIVSALARARSVSERGRASAEAIARAAFSNTRGENTHLYPELRAAHTLLLSDCYRYALRFTSSSDIAIASHQGWVREGGERQTHGEHRGKTQKTNRDIER